MSSDISRDISRDMSRDMSRDHFQQGGNYNAIYLTKIPTFKKK